LRGLATQAQRRINAVEQGLIDQETAGQRAPSANIAPPIARRQREEGERPGAS
jgi:hypothetical protein